jgi:glutathione gamma-glutamylcysteinyltransferase
LFNFDLFQVIERQGITFDQFICLAVCNTLDIRHFRADVSNSEQDFRQLVTEKTRCANDVIVVSYSRQTLQQTGEGHFSPIGGYHPDRDLVLIMDVARFKYPPHWVSLSLLFEAMQQIDIETS